MRQLRVHLVMQPGHHPGPQYLSGLARAWSSGNPVPGAGAVVTSFRTAMSAHAQRQRTATGVGVTIRRRTASCCHLSVISVASRSAAAAAWGKVLTVVRRLFTHQVTTGVRMAIASATAARSAAQCLPCRRGSCWSGRSRSLPPPLRTAAAAVSATTVVGPSSHESDSPAETALDGGQRDCRVQHDLSYLYRGREMPRSCRSRPARKYD